MNDGFKTQWNEAYYKPVRKAPVRARSTQGVRVFIDREAMMDVMRAGAHSVQQISEATGFCTDALRRHLYTMTELGLIKATRKRGLPTKWEVV